MSDSDSDYDVEEYIQPDTIRRTYNNEDQLSEHEEESQDESDKSEGEKSEEDEAEIKTPSCKLNNGTNGFTESDVSEPVKVIPSQSSEPAKTNSRFILYVTNLTAEITRSILEDFFSDAGAVKSIRTPKIRIGCYAFVEMKDFEGYKNGLKFNNREIDGRKIQVYEGSKNKKHTTNTSKDMKRKKQQAHLSTISMSKKMKPNK